MRSFMLGFALLITALGPAVSTTTAATSNENTAQQIADNLKESGRLKGYRVGVKYEDGVAWLKGTVTSEHQKMLTEEIARNSEGVQHVISKIEVVGIEESATPASFEQSKAASNSAPQRQASRQVAPRQAQRNSSNMPVPYAYTSPQGNIQAASYSQQAQYCPEGGYMPGADGGGGGGGFAPGSMGPSVNYDNPQMPGYAWPSYAASPNYAALTYPKQYSASAWPYIGPFYPYPQVPLGWRKVTLEWDDGWWFLDFKDCKNCR
ncbi:BON domain-containing protein [Bythopirellula polymerisocia]|uniref:BON domain protein n=1 Tax=Bythopirellula polymerisocia TaxID=2528003 RepID=A0A5C6CVQ7_9BACT|nr:BON domain-containing protein [Bythopirellula polymerisocia]TWU27531.1 BON domain protein [Bythopirellula polymerisocia]